VTPLQPVLPYARPVPLFVELCAGTAAVSVRLHHQHGKPPISRQGAKAGYADAILRVLGLRPGQRALRYLWAEADLGAQLLLHSYTQPQLAAGAAAQVRAWAGEQPRELWQRLRSQGPLQADPPTAGELARWCRLATSNRLIHLCPTTWQNTGDGGSTFGGASFCTPALRLADALAAAPCVGPATVVPAVAPPTEPLPDGAVVYMDPPYLGTSTYAHHLPRAQVVQVALAWAAAGATVAISEAEPLPELVAQGWHAQELTWCKRGHRRTFSRQQREFLTMNRQPVHPGRPRRPLLGGKRGKVL
jgi:hypothetical protein